MGGTAGVDYEQYVDSVGQCLAECECTTVQRIAMWMAQVGTESAGLRYMEEIADGSEYEGRSDLGNTNPGDGQRYKGRGPIQVTGRHNYTVLSQWAFDQGSISTPTFFVDNPDQLASPEYGFMGVTWYWTTQRPMKNAADAGDVKLATEYVNGGYHGLPDRQARYDANMRIGDTLLCLVGVEEAAPPEKQLVMAGLDINRLNAAIDKILGGNTAPTQWPSRSFLAESGAGVDDTIGMLLNIDANAWTLVLTIGYLSDLPLAVQQVEKVAQGKFPPGSFVDHSDWLKKFGQDYCKGLIAFKKKMNTVISYAINQSAQKAAPAKKATS